MNKYNYYIILQGNYGYGWEDISDIELMNQIKKQQQKDILSLKKK